MKIKIDFVGILRGIACIAIIMVHAPLSPEILSSWLRNLSETTSYFAIFLFFLLSGFVLGKGFLAGKYKLSLSGILNFYWKRFKRIAPLYYLIIFFLFLKTPIDLPNRINYFLRYLSFTGTPSTQIYSSGYLWFISTLAQLYLLVPIGFFILHKLETLSFSLKRNVLLTVILFDVVFIYRIVATGILIQMYAFWLINVPVFFTGMLLSLFVHKTSRHAGVFFFPLLFFSLVGSYSYEIYLLHQPILSYLRLSCGPYCTLFVFLRNILIVLLISLALAVIIRKGFRLLFNTVSPHKAHE